MAKMILQNINKKTGEILETPKFRTKYDAHYNKEVEHFDSEYMLDDTGYTPLKALVERCIMMGNNPFNKPSDYEADVEVSQDDFMSEDFADKLDEFDASIEYQQVQTPVTPNVDTGVVNTNPVDNVTVSENEVKADV